MTNVSELFHSGVLYITVSLYFLLASVYAILLLKKNRNLVKRFETFLKGFCILSPLVLLVVSEISLYYIGCLGLLISFLLFSFGVGKLVEGYTIKKKSK